MKKNYLRFGSLFLKYVVGIYVVIWLVKNEDIDFRTLRVIDGPAALLATILSVIPMFLSAWRIQLLLTVHNIEVPLIRCATYNAIGVFYSTILPGGMSGDAVRAYYFWQCKHTDESSMSELLGALVTDRIIGLLMMVFIGLVSATFVSKALDITLLSMLAAWLLFAACILTYIYLCAMHRYTFTFSASDNSLKKSLVDRVQRLASNLDMWGYPAKTVTLCFFLSAIMHVSSVLVIYMFSNRLASGLDFGQVMAIAPVGLLINVIPVSPGGLGVGEKGFEMLYSLVGGQQGGNIFMISRVFLYLPAVFGACFAVLALIRRTK